MRETLSFPGLGLEFEVGHVPIFTVGGISIYWYGVLIALAFLLGVVYVLKRVGEFGLDGDRVIDVIMGGVLLGIVGARLYYVLFKWEYFSQDPASIFRIWEGGIAIYGGIIGALIAGVLICKWRRVKLLPLLDVVSAGMLLGQAIGRWGNFVNIEAFGSNTSMPWGMTSPSIVAYLRREAASLSALGVTVDPTQPVHPTFFYESVWCLLGFGFLAWFTKRRRFDGQMALIYLGWYGLGRFFIEGLRTDSLLLGSLRVSQIIALLCVIGSLLALVSISSKIRRANDPDFMPLYVNTPEGQAVLAGTFYQDAASPTVGGSASADSDAEAEGDAKEETAESAGEEASSEAAGERALSSAPSGGKEPAVEEVGADSEKNEDAQPEKAEAEQEEDGNGGKDH